MLFFGNDWFAENRTSSHQIARQLAQRFRVYYVECPGWRVPRGSGRDLKKVFVKLWRFLKERALSRAACGCGLCSKSRSTGSPRSAG